MLKLTCLISIAYSKRKSVSKRYDIYQRYLHMNLCVGLCHELKSDAIMNSSSKATFIVTVSEDIDHVQKFLTLCQCLYLDRWTCTDAEYGYTNVLFMKDPHSVRQEVI